MKKIDPAFKETIKMTCPFCSLGCEFGLVISDFGLRGIEYISEGVSEGRLCPRGSAAVGYLNHPKRLSMPMKKDKVIPWSKLIKDLKKVFAGPDKLAVTFDRNVTLEEYELITSCCRAAGIEHVASAYLEPESFLSGFAGRSADIDSLASPGAVVVIGDPFSQSPVISKKLITWKMSDRKNRLIVIDSMMNHTALFATDFISVPVGAEPIVLYALAQEDGIQKLPSGTLSSDKQKELAKAIKDAANGMIMVSLSFGHSYDPELLVDATEILGKTTNKGILPLVEYFPPSGNVSFGELIGKHQKGSLNYLVNFGELFPYYYPQLFRELKFKEIYATSPLKHNEFTSIPFALNLEKRGTIMTSKGRKELSGGIKPASGARSVEEIFDMIDIRPDGKGGFDKPDRKIDRKARTDGLIEKINKPMKKKTLRLVGEKTAFNFMNIFEDEILKINPADAHDNGLSEVDRIFVESKHGKSGFKMAITGNVPPGVISVSAESATTRGLFDYDIVDGSIYFIPTEVQIWRKG